MLGIFIISHQPSLSSPLLTPGHPPHGKPLALLTHMEVGAPKNRCTVEAGGKARPLVPCGGMTAAPGCPDYPAATAKYKKKAPFWWCNTITFPHRTGGK